MADRLIVVGVDGSPGSRAALRFAVTEARFRKARILAVHAWWALPELEPDGVVAGEHRQTISGEDATRLVEEFVEHTVGPARSELTIEAMSVQGVAATQALVQAARNADLLVVGARGLGGFRGLLLGSVSRQCAQHAACPVVIVRDPAR